MKSGVAVPQNAEPLAPPAGSEAHGHGNQGLARLALGAVGVVFGDIGTSPLYAFRETFAGHHRLTPDAGNVRVDYANGSVTMGR